MSTEIKKVILQEPVLAHYRRDVFAMLAANENPVFGIVAGKEFEGIKRIENVKYKTFSFTSFGSPGHRFYYLRGAVRFILSEKPDAVICTGVDFHQLHSILLFIVQRLLLRKKFFWWSHATPGKQGMAGRAARKFFYKKATGILAYSRNGKRFLETMGINSANICVVNNSLNTEDYGYLNTTISRSPVQGKLRIVFCGRITPSKKIDLLISALSEIKKKNTLAFECEIIGGGETASLIDETKKLGLDEHIHFTGALYGEQLRNHLLNSDVMVYPGGIGLSIVQAFSYGIPVITTDLLNLHGPEIELLEPGSNGEFYKNDSADNLAEKIIQWNQKLKTSGEAVMNACINSIMQKGYLPEIVAGNAIRFVKEKLNISVPEVTIQP